MHLHLAPLFRDFLGVLHTITYWVRTFIYKILQYNSYLDDEMILAVRCLKNLINPIRSWSSWFRRILHPSIFINKSSLNRNRILFGDHQKRSLKRVRNKNWIRFWLMTIDSLLGPVDRWVSCRQLIWRVDKLSSLLFSVFYYRQVLLTTYSVQSAGLSTAIIFFEFASSPNSSFFSTSTGSSWPSSPSWKQGNFTILQTDSF